MSPICVALDQELAGEYATYARKAGMSLESLVERILDDWMEDSRRFDASRKAAKAARAIMRESDAALANKRMQTRSKEETAIRPVRSMEPAARSFRSASPPEN